MRLYLKNFEYSYEGPFPFDGKSWDKLEEFASYYVGYLVIDNVNGQGDEIIAREDFDTIGVKKEKPKTYIKNKKKK